MSDVRSLAIDLVLHNEGGHKPGGDPNDPGGDTWYGLSRTSYPHLTPWPPTREVAAAIYGLMFDALHGADLPARVAVFHLDVAVNHGGALPIMQDGAVAGFTLHGGTEEVPAAPRMLQRALRYFAPRLVEDGDVGPKTLAAAWGIDGKALLRRYFVIRNLRYHAIHTFPANGEGWSERMAYSFQVALLMTVEAR